MLPKPPLIAVVDDEDAVCRALRRLLQTNGFEVRAFDSGRAFMDALPGEQPECLVLDLHMPHMGGLAVLARLQQERPGLPAIVITGHDSPEARDGAARFGVGAFFRKPVDGEALVAAILALLTPPGGPSVAGPQGDTP
ncbi:MAG: response regulator transcription factor [Phycisphaerales bacterium JB037]